MRSPFDVDGRLEAERDEWRKRALEAEAKLEQVLSVLGHGEDCDSYDNH